MTGLTKRFIDFLESAFSQSKPFIIGDNKFVVKNYDYEPAIIKWLIVKTANTIANVYPFVFDPYTRMDREVNFMKNMHGVIDVPKILLVDWINKLVVREYVEGSKVEPENYKHHILIAKTLARIHSENYVMGDTKYANFIVSGEDKVYVIDGEQSIMTENLDYMAWDLTGLTVTLIQGLLLTKLFRTPKNISLSIKKLLKTYIDEKDDGVKIVKRMLKFKTKNIIYLLLPTPYNYYVVKSIKEVIGID